MNLFTDLDFGQALKYLRLGRKVQRSGWNGRGMHLELVTGSSFPCDVSGYGNYVSMPLEPFIVMFTADKKWVPWLASQTDILASDWQVV